MALTIAQAGRQLSERVSLAFLWSKLPWAVIGFGILVRVVQYIHNSSLWVDEAALSLNIVNKSFSGLTGPLDYFTAAPIGFLMSVKLAVEVLGNHEYVLRLVPLFAGVGSLLLMYSLAKKFLTPGAVLIALILFACSTPLVRYSTQVKQYSSDVFFALLVLLLSAHILERDFDGKWLVLYALVGAAVIWFSFPIVFVLAGAAVTMGLFLSSKKDWPKLVSLTAVGLVWLVSFFLSYQSPAVSELAGNEGVGQVLAVRSNFVPFPPLSASDVQWYTDSLFDLFQVPMGLTFTGIGALGLVIGCFSLARTNKLRLSLILLPMLVTILVSIARLYPFDDRWILFLVPFALLLVAEGTIFIVARTRSTYPAIGIVLVGLLLFHPIASETFRLLSARGSEEVRPVLQFVIDNRADGDKLYVYYGARKAFSYYADRYGLKEEDYVIGTRKVDGGYGNPGLNDFTDQINSLRGNRRVWFLFSNVHETTYPPGAQSGGINDKQFILYNLDKVGVRIDKFQVQNAVVYLYDLSSDARAVVRIAAP